MTASRVIPILTLSYMIGSTVALGSIIIMCKGINNCFVSKHETRGNVYTRKDGDGDTAS